jgi:hypothetical protein
MTQLLVCRTGVRQHPAGPNRLWHRSVPIFPCFFNFGATCFREGLVNGLISRCIRSSQQQHRRSDGRISGSGSRFLLNSF